MMDEDQELRFVCKLCFKRYPCGKSLGGHMRSHVVANSAESDEKFDPNFKKFSQFVVGGGIVGYAGSGGGGGGLLQGTLSDSRMVELGNGQSSYGLRENPRKSWRAADSTFPMPQEKICKQCGKGFQSLKALCGHMACHSEKDRGMKDDQYSWTSENQKMVMDSHSDTEGEDRVIRTRSSKSKRFRKISVVNINGSSSLSELDGDEQEEVAMCLMMLSRDVNSVMESSDNNSVILETKSSSIDMKNGGKGAAQIKKIVVDDVENSDSGYFLDECGKAESDVSVDGLRRSGGYNEYDEFRESLIRSKLYRAEVKRQLAKENEQDHDRDRDDHHSDLAARIEQSRKRRYVSEKYNDYERVKVKTSSGSGSGEMCLNTSSEKRPKYECFNCKKVFKSYQALGGHRPCHKKTTVFHEKYDSGDDSTEFIASRGGGGGKLVESSSSNKNTSAKINSSDKKLKASKKNKGHVCPFCNRVFKNGQALGGHKRSHFIGGHEVHTNNPTPVTKIDLLDLNLPAPHEDEDDGNDQYSPW